MSATGSTPELAARLGLIIEDETFFTTVLTRLLEQEGITASVARDSGEARTILRRETFDVILVDLRLPAEDGPILIEDIEAQPHLASRAIVVTSYPTVAKMFSTRLPVVPKEDVDAIRQAVRKVLEREPLMARIPLPGH